jgi:hypothetical protein
MPGNKCSSFLYATTKIVSTTLTVLITLKVSISFLVTLHFLVTCANGAGFYKIVCTDHESGSCNTLTLFFNLIFVCMKDNESSLHVAYYANQRCVTHYAN